MTEIDTDKLRLEIHTGDGKTINRGDDWTLLAGDIAIMDESGFRSLDGPPFIARTILAMAEENKRLREALERIAQANRGEGGCYYTNLANIAIARRALGKEKA